jgi:peptide/nickel transport system substrate-binding protein
MAVRLNAIRGDRAAIEFRGFPPKARDDLVNALGDKITVQESDWNCNLLLVPNHKAKPFDDVRVRQALILAVDRWGGSKYLSKIAIVKTVGGVVFPNHPLAATADELKKLHGYNPDINASRDKARALLAEAGQSNLSFEFHNRGVDQPYKVVGTWLIDQWTKIGLKVTQRVQPSPQFYATLRKKKDFEVSMGFNCQSVINPIADVTKFLGSAGNNYGSYEDQELEDIYDKLLRSGDEAEQRVLMRQYEKRALHDQAHMGVTLWWYKINPHRSYVKGWKIAPSHYLNQQLDNIWLDK